MAGEITTPAPVITPGTGDAGSVSDSAASIAEIKRLTLMGAQDNVELTKIGVLAQRIANEGKAWQSIQSNLKSGVATLSQVG